MSESVRKASRKYYQKNSEKIKQHKKETYGNRKLKNEYKFLLKKINSKLEINEIIDAFFNRKTKYPRLLNQMQVLEYITKERGLIIDIND